MKKAFLLISVLFVSLQMMALDFEVDGLHFVTTDDDSNDVEITFQKAQDDNYEYLTSLTIPENVTYQKTPYRVVAIGKAAFAYARNLTDVTIPASIRDIHPHAFYGCAKLKRVKFNKGLQTIDKMAFAYSGVEEVVLPNGLTTLGDLAFAYCEKLARLSFPNSITHFGANTFKDCKSLEKIRFADGLNVIGEYAFAGCKSLKKVVLPNGLKQPSKGAFADCESLEEITLSADMEDLGVGVFDNCDALANIQIPAQSKYLKSTADGVLLSSDGKSLFYYPIGKREQTYDVPANIERIGANAFSANKHVTQVNIPANVKEIGIDAFAGCKQLKKVNMSEGLQIIRKGAFSQCVALNGIVIPKSVWKIERGAFTGCGDYNNKRNWKARVLYIGDCLIGKSDDQQKTGNLNVRPGTRLIADHALEGSFLAELDVPEGVEIIGERAFFDSPRLALISLPASLTQIGSQAFDSTAYYNTDKNWKNGVLYVDKVLLRVDPEIDGKLKLKKVVIIADDAFANCNEVTSVKLPDALLHIGKHAFLNCSGLQEINVPKQLKTVGVGAFDGADNIDKTLFYQAAQQNNPQANDLFDVL